MWEKIEDLADYHNVLTRILARISAWRFEQKWKRDRFCLISSRCGSASRASAPAREPAGPTDRALVPRRTSWPMIAAKTTV
jgi:hypothetical protein